MCDLGLELAKSTVVACTDSRGKERWEGVSRRAKYEVRLEKGRVTVVGRGLRLEQRSEKGALSLSTSGVGRRAASVSRPSARELTAVGRARARAVPGCAHEA